MRAYALCTFQLGGQVFLGESTEAHFWTAEAGCQTREASPKTFYSSIIRQPAVLCFLMGIDPANSNNGWWYWL